MWADVVHLTTVYNFPTFPTLFCARFGRKPFVWSPRGMLQRWTMSRRVLAKNVWDSVSCMLLPRRTALHVTSEEEAAESAQRLGHPLTRVIPNGIDIPCLPPPTLQDGTLKLLFIGRLDPKKGIENLISSAAMLSGLGIANWSLKIVGDGERVYVSQLRKLVCASGMNARVEFCGHFNGEQKYQAFTKTDIVVVPSYTENFGNVVAEALAHARPVIASRGTPWRQIEQHKCGLWVPNDPRSLATAIFTLAKCDRTVMGQRGRDWMENAFSWKDRARDMLSLYEELVNA